MLVYTTGLLPCCWWLRLSSRDIFALFFWLLPLIIIIIIIISAQGRLGRRWERPNTDKEIRDRRRRSRASQFLKEAGPGWRLAGYSPVNLPQGANLQSRWDLRMPEGSQQEVRHRSVMPCCAVPALWDSYLAVRCTRIASALHTGRQSRRPWWRRESTRST